MRLVCFAQMALVFVLLSLSGLLFAVEADDKAQVRSGLGFPLEYEQAFRGQVFKLALIGESQREFLFFDVYKIAFYQSANPINGQAGVELLSIVYQRDLSIGKLHEVLLEGFQNNTDSRQWQEIKPKVDALLSKIDQNAREGDRLIIMNLSPADVVFIYNDREILRIDGHVFNQALWDIWLGVDSVVDRAALSGENKR